jgi:type 1 glutamine amidotransferase
MSKNPAWQQTDGLCPKCTRPDHDYAMSWIKSFDKGRVFYTPLGHTPILFTNPK